MEWLYNKRGEKFIIVEVISKRKVLVRFESGYETYKALKAVQKGTVLDRSKNPSVGKIFSNNFGTSFEIIEYVHARKVKIKFLDEYGIEKYTNCYNILKGDVRNPYDRMRLGVGYMGVGLYDSNHRAYELWASMLERCYTDREPVYKDCYVNGEWHNFQNFAGWCEQQRFFGIKGFHLDKDLSVRGNREYGPNFCSFVPQKINTLTLSVKKARGKYKIGATFDTQHGKFLSQAQINGKLTRLGFFDTEDEAFIAYKIAKEKYIKEVVEEYKEFINEKVYSTLFNWTVNEND